MAYSFNAKVDLSQHESLMIEALRGLGWSNDDIMTRVRSGELPIDESDFHFDYSELTAFDTAQPAVFEAAVREGYRMKFNTLGGIRCWIYLALGKEPEVSRVPGSEYVAVSLTDIEKERLANALSNGWKLESGSDTNAAGEPLNYIVPVQRVNL